MFNKKLISFIILTIVILGISFSFNKVNLVFANPLTVIEEAAGGLIPDNGTYLQMIEANVLFDIDETYGSSGSFFISFDWNYTIYNQNSTVNVSIAAPFFSTYYGLEDTLRIEVEGINVDYYIEDYWEIDIS